MLIANSALKDVHAWSNEYDNFTKDCNERKRIDLFIVYNFSKKYKTSSGFTQTRRLLFFLYIDT
jgi:hypothetical protein